MACLYIVYFRPKITRYNYLNYIYININIADMERIMLSRDISFYKYIMGFVTLFCIYIMIMYHNDGRSIIIAGIAGVISFIITYRSYYSSTLEFDDENIYVSNKRGDEDIPLKNVTSFKLTSLQLNNRHFWKLQYTDDIGDEQSIKFLPLYGSLDSFMDKVKMKNPEVEIKNSTGFFG